MKKRIGLGTWSWGNKLLWNYQSTNDDDLRETYNEALRRGFDLIDTADSYGTGNLQGRSELLIGIFLLNTPSSKKKRISLDIKKLFYKVKEIKIKNCSLPFADKKGVWPRPAQVFTLLVFGILKVKKFA